LQRGQGGPEGAEKKTDQNLITRGGYPGKKCGTWRKNARGTKRLTGTEKGEKFS